MAMDRNTRTVVICLTVVVDQVVVVSSVVLHAVLGQPLRRLVELVYMRVALP